MNNQFKEAMMLLMSNKISLIGKDKNKLLFDIIDEPTNHTVAIQTKPGRSIITCSCTGCSRFCNEPTICKYKIACLMFYWSKMNGLR